MEIGAVIVAAGMSSRMGDFKPMLSIGEISVAQRVVATLRQAGPSAWWSSRAITPTSWSGTWPAAGVFVRNEKLPHDGDVRLGAHRAQIHEREVRPDTVHAGGRAALHRGHRAAAAGLRRGAGLPRLQRAAWAPDTDVGLRRAEAALRQRRGRAEGALARCGVEEALVEVEDTGILHDADTRRTSGSCWSCTTASWCGRYCRCPWRGS